MVRFRISSIFLLFLLVSPRYSEIISVVQGEQGHLQVRPGVVSGWITQANFTEKFIQTGWNYLDIISNERYEDNLQAVGAGLAEGYLTSQLILHYYKEFIAKDLCIPDPKFCTWVLEILHTNKKWALEQEVSNKTDYWKMVRLFYKQMEGMQQGLKMKNPDKTGLELVEMNYEDIVLLINFLPNLGDFLQKYKSEKLKVSFPSCSALIKIYDDNIIISHSTWHEYRSMHYRLLKRFILNYHDIEGQLIPGHKISMSSYAGTIYSLDDFYILSSGMVSLETTLFVFNQTLLQDLNPLGRVLEPIRVMVSNRLATSASSWANTFEKFNCGTYNNQWMILDYNKIGSDSGLLHVLEQLPGKIVQKDMTSFFTQQGYWASYNRAFFQEIFQKSGGQEMSERFGDWFSYSNTPRARIFRSNQQTVQDKETMYNLMRSNNYDASNEGQVQGCNGSIPVAAIAARTDLQDENVGCTWSQFDYMEGRRNYGALDVKIVDSSNIHHGSMLAENGPTHSGRMEPFSWSDEDIPDHSPVRTYNFSAVKVTWRDTEETLPIQPRSGSEPGARFSQFILLSILLVSLRN